MKVDYDFVLSCFKKKDQANPFIKNLISDLFWPITEWPRHILLNLYWCKYSDRISIVSFLRMNGMPLEDALHIIQFYCKESENGTHWRVRETQLRSVWERCKFIEMCGTPDQRKGLFLLFNDRSKSI